MTVVEIEMESQYGILCMTKRKRVDITNAVKTKESIINLNVRNYHAGSFLDILMQV